MQKDKMIMSILKSLHPNYPFQRPRRTRDISKPRRHAVSSDRQPPQTDGPKPTRDGSACSWEADRGGGSTCTCQDDVLLAPSRIEVGVEATVQALELAGRHNTSHTSHPPCLLHE